VLVELPQCCGERPGAAEPAGNLLFEAPERRQFASAVDLAAATVSTPTGFT